MGRWGAITGFFSAGAGRMLWANNLVRNAVLPADVSRRIHSEADTSLKPVTVQLGSYLAFGAWTKLADSQPAGSGEAGTGYPRNRQTPIVSPAIPDVLGGGQCDNRRDVLPSTTDPSGLSRILLISRGLEKLRRWPRRRGHFIRVDHRPARAAADARALTRAPAQSRVNAGRCPPGRRAPGPPATPPA